MSYINVKDKVLEGVLVGDGRDDYQPTCGLAFVTVIESERRPQLSGLEIMTLGAMKYRSKQSRINDCFE